MGAKCNKTVSKSRDVFQLFALLFAERICGPRVEIHRRTRRNALGIINHPAVHHLPRLRHVHPHLHGHQTSFVRVFPSSGISRLNDFRMSQECSAASSLSIQTPIIQQAAWQECNLQRCIGSDCSRRGFI